MVRPFADTLGRIFYPISRFFMLWGRAIYADYREKYKKYVGEGMSPIEASIKASTEAFIDGIVGLFTGTVGGIDLGSSIITIVESIVGAFLKAVSDPATMVGILLIGGMIVTAVGVALLAAAAAFTLAMITIAAMIQAAAAAGLTTGAITAAFTGLGVLAGSLIGSAITVGLAALPFAIAAAAFVAATWLENEITRILGWREPPPGGPGPAPGIPGGMPGAPMWPWEPGFKWPWEGAVGGIVTRPTFGLIGEAGPEAVIPLSKMVCRVAKGK